MFSVYGHVVPPVYLEKRGTPIEHHGSGVLVKSEEGYWLFSAAHVLAGKAMGRILLPGTPDFFTPSGKVISSCTLLPEVANKDRVDLCYLSLTADEAQRLVNGGASFLPCNEDTIEPDGLTPYPGKGSISGFPKMAVKIEGRQANVHMTDLLKMDFASPERLRKAGFDPEISIGLVRERKLWLEGKPLRDFVPRGMSGGAIWAHSEDKLRLVGIFTEYYGSKSLLIGTRLSPLMTELTRRLRAGHH